MANKAVLEVEDFKKVLEFVADQKVSVPNAPEVFNILKSALLMDITIIPSKEEEELMDELPFSE